MTKYYIAEQKVLPPNPALHWMWILIVEGEFIVWSQAFALTDNTWYPGAVDGFTLNECLPLTKYTLTSF